MSDLFNFSKKMKINRNNILYLETNSGLQYQENCTVCDGGQYCSIAGKSEPEGNCSARYYCPEGSTSAIGLIII